MAGSATSWTPPPVPGQGNPAAPAPTPGEDPVSQWLSDVWQGQVEDAQRVGWMFSYGWGKLTQDPGGPERDLASAIYQKMGPAAPPANLPAGTHLPDANYVLARQAAHQAMVDPNYRQQLVQALGWNQNNPHVAFWVEHGGGVPSDPTGTGLAPGATPPTTSPATPTPTVIAASPFPASAWKGRGSDPGFLYGALLPPRFAAAAGVDRQWGVDYAMDLGTPLSAPFAGTVTEADFNGPYGNTVVIKLANGYTYRVAHLQGMNVRVGDKVNAGALLGQVGSTGNSTGPHVLIEMRDGNGKPVDPTGIVDSLLKGDTTGANKILGDYASADAAMPGPIKTTDGFLFYPGSQSYSVFVVVQNLWRKRYGSDPPGTFVSSLIAAGDTTAEQVQSAMDQMSSDIAGLNWGARDALTNDANQQSLKAWDRPVPDSVIKQLAAKGITTPGQIEGWINSHPASAIAPDDFKSIYDATNPKTQELWQQPPSPDLIKHIYDQMNQGPQS